MDEVLSEVSDMENLDLNLTQNRFEILNSSQCTQDGGLARANRVSQTNNDEWTNITSKRKRSVRGSIDLETFEQMNTSSKLNVLFEKINHVEEAQENLQSIKTSISATNDKVNLLGSKVDSNTNNLTSLAYKILDLDARNRQKNLLIYGIKEESDRSTYEIVDDFLFRHLNLEAEDMCIDECVRLGRVSDARGAVQKRPIQVTFRYVEEVNTCMKYAYRLARTNIAIDRDYPPEIRNARKRLWPEVKHLRRQDPKPNVKLLFPAAIELNGRIIKDKFPGWDKNIKGLINIEEIVGSVSTSSTQCFVTQQVQDPVRAFAKSNQTVASQSTQTTVNTQTISVGGETRPKQMLHGQNKQPSPNSSQQRRKSKASVTRKVNTETRGRSVSVGRAPAQRGRPKSKSANKNSRQATTPIPNPTETPSDRDVTGVGGATSAQ